DKAEGFSSRPVHNYNGIPQYFPGLFLDTTGSPLTARFNITGNAPNNRDVKILLNNDSLTQFPLGYFLTNKKVISGIPANWIKNDIAGFATLNLSDVNDDELRIASIELEYPRVFNFGGASTFEFYIEPSNKGRYLKIANFNKGTSAAALYDLANGKRYIADTSITDTLQFLLPPSQEKYHLVLVQADGSTSKTISTLQSRQFINFTQSVNQGNYLIISNPLLYGSGSSNYVQQYSDYRSSDSGGKFNSKIINIHELEDQFAYGLSMHPLAIKNFLRFARTNFSEQPKYVFLIGKGMSYTAWRLYETNPLNAQLDLVPVWGSPGSDNLLSSDNYDPIPTTPIGRLSAVTPEEVGVYLEKMKQYEAAQRNTSGTIEEKLWMKKVLQLAGANDPQIGYTIDSAQAKYKQIISDSLFGGDVSTFSKTVDPSGYPQALFEFTNEYNKGSALLEYLGHSSSSSIDFSLDNPANYNNEGRYPVFIVNGCLAGNIFNYDVNRFNNRSTLSEKFILEPKRGAIAYLSSSSFGVLNYLDIFTEQFYKSITLRQYGKGLGNIVSDGISHGLDYTGYFDFYGKMHAEQFTLHGDPALKLNSFSAPDYAIDSSRIFIAPDYLTVASDSFTVKAKIYNLGKAINDSVHFSVLRKFPNGNAVSIFSGNLQAINSVDSIVLRLPIVGNRDKGITVITATIDDNNLIPELSEQNNTASVNVKISAADLLPVSPYNYAIVNTNSV
ncbi:MAG TPA: C25 family cysteine peptidase, partial [Chitinophagaceae bacterium]|nr:C25 family cysteine peptidase [Chitinophagaceae bacterium]